MQKIHAVDPLICPNCNSTMPGTAFNGDSDVVKKILKDLRLWHMKRQWPTKAHDLPIESVTIYENCPALHAHDYLIDVDYSAKACLYKIRPQATVELRSNLPKPSQSA